ncbi:MAG: adenylate kinase [Halanaerobiales bacterium]
MNIVLLGLPGAGKGTQAKNIRDKFGLHHISTGDIFRKALEEETPLGMKAKEYMDEGKLVPDEITIGIMENYVQDHTDEKGLVFDGFPRTLQQAEALAEILAGIEGKVDLCIYIQVAEDELIIRISGRRICEDCGAIYHTEFNPPGEEGVCSKCGGSLYQRDDDREEIVRERIKENREKTEELIDYYRNQGVLEKVVGTGKMPEDVMEKVEKIVGEKIQ